MTVSFNAGEIACASQSAGRSADRLDEIAGGAIPPEPMMFGTAVGVAAASTMPMVTAAERAVISGLGRAKDGMSEGLRRTAADYEVCESEAERAVVDLWLELS